MGLMTSPKAQKVISSFVLKSYRPLGILLYLGAFVAILIVSSNQFSANTYISENALLPGLVDRQYKSAHDVAGYSEHLDTLKDLEGGIPSAWLEEKFQEIGLDTYSQNFSVSHPFQEADGKLTGTNVFAILRAPRIAGTEAVVFSVPYRQGQTEIDLGSTSHGIALMFSLAKLFIQQTYWSKDIIFLIVDKENIGAQAWLEAYHEVSSDYIHRSPLHGRSGAVMAAVNLELPDKRVDHLDIRIEGLNGQLPNLDLFNMVVKLCHKEGVQPTFHGEGSLSYHQLQEFFGIKYTSKTMLSNMLRQASGKPYGIHGLFLRYGVPAITLHGQPSGSTYGDQTYSVGCVMEGIFRSINNLLERFHQSFFFYVLPETRKYVSIGLYMIPMGMLLVIPTLQGLALWFLSEPKNSKPDKDGTSSQSNDKFRQHHYAIPTFIGVHVCGVLLYLSPEFFVSSFSSYFGLSSGEALVTGLAAVFTGITLLQVFNKSDQQEVEDNQEKKWMLLKCYALVWQAVSLLALSMINFSLAFLVAIFTIPVFAVCRPYNNFIFSVLNKLMLLLVSPPLLLCLLIAAHDIIFKGHSISLNTIANVGSVAMGSIPSAVIDQYLFNDWTFAVVTLVLFPSWQMFWISSSVKGLDTLKSRASVVLHNKKD